MEYKKRIEKLEDFIKTNLSQKKTIEMSKKEMRAITDKVLNNTDPPVPFYAKTKDGYVNVYEIKDIDLKGKITNDYVHRRIELYRKEQLDAFGVKEVSRQLSG